MVNGSFRLKEWRLNDRIRLERNAAYWDAAHVGMGSIDVLPIDNPATAVNFFLTGGADLTVSAGAPHAPKPVAATPPSAPSKTFRRLIERVTTTSESLSFS